MSSGIGKSMPIEAWGEEYTAYGRWSEVEGAEIEVGEARHL